MDTRQSDWLRAGLQLAVAGVFYWMVTLFFFAPTLSHLNTHLIGDGGDCFEFYWNAWWIDRSLLHGHNPYWCDLQFAPWGVPLVLHTLSLIPSMCIALLGRAISLPVADNLMVITLYPIAGVCMFVLARFVTRSSAGALAGGLAFMLCPFLASKSLGHLNLQCAALLPLFTYCLLRAVEQDPHPDPPPPSGGGNMRKWWLGLVFVLILFCNVHTAIFAGNVALWCFLYFSITQKQWGFWFRRFFTALGPTLMVCALWGGFVGFYTFRYGLKVERYAAVNLWPEPVSYLLPLHSNSVWQGWFARWDSLSTLELAVYLGWIVLPIAAVGWWVERDNRLMRMMFVFFVAALVLSLGDKLRWNGDTAHIGKTPVRLPLNVYRYVLVLGSIGQSGRYLVIGYMAMGVGMAAAVAALYRRWSRWMAHACTLAVLGLVGLDFGFRPIIVALPRCAIPPGDGLVMDPRLGNARALYEQTLHGRPLVGGYIARIPTSMRQNYEQMPGLGWFFQPPQRRKAAPNPEQVLAALHRERIEYVCVAPGSPDDKLLEECGLERILTDEQQVVLRVRGYNDKNGR